MEITLGDTIKVNGEEVPEYMLKALHEHLKVKYEDIGAVSCSHSTLNGVSIKPEYSTEASNLDADKLRSLVWPSYIIK
ncbi:hypothetical protein KRX11_10055 [Pasteurellaceae bacterium TAE3-ERU1]|uniref:hypothetical protein n=1 Tax=Spirabiliibacterium mucosae TaxID=28156 RepID=UPI001AADB0F0|nr:hypothetical protein [Spirabiliibacterium mucosae]MBE2898098.1 hypothetical protein [Spirabiliibacterium mucosae]MBV7388976.1 hypothetical protein [Pasteurellaceae bacterium TAE3-ERU1]